MSKNENPLVSVIMPAYNEGLSIAKTLSDILATSSLDGAEIIVVDDGSRDGTCSEVRKFDGVRLVEHPVNRGYGAALVTGMKKARGRFAVWIDSDGQHRASDLAAVVSELVSKDLDYCVGVRNKASYQDPRRVLGKWVLRQVVYLAAGQRVPDFNSGLRGFNLEVIKKYLHLFPNGFGASTITTLIMLHRNCRGGYVPITVLPRSGKSSVKQFRDGFRTLALILRTVLLFNPLLFFGVAGITLLLGGASYGVWEAVAEGRGFPVLGAMAFVAGVQTLFLGLVMDQVSAMRRERFE